MVKPVTSSRGCSRPYLFYLVVLILAYSISILRETFIHGGDCEIVKNFCSDIWKNLGHKNLLNLFIGRVFFLVLHFVLSQLLLNKIIICCFSLQPTMKLFVYMKNIGIKTHKFIKPLE